MTSVAVIEDHPVFRRAVAQAIEGSPGFVLTGGYANIEDYDLAAGPSDVVVLDLNLPGLGGADGVRHVRSGGSRVLVLSASDAPELVLDALAEGACGYITKGAEMEEILRALATVAQGSTYVSPTLAGLLLTAHQRAGPPGTELTGREREILALVAQGERDVDIAEALSISVWTVRSHLDRIRDKTGQRRRADLTRFAIEKGVIPKPRHP